MVIFQSFLQIQKVQPMVQLAKAGKNCFSITRSNLGQVVGPTICIFVWYWLPNTKYIVFRENTNDASNTNTVLKRYCCMNYSLIVRSVFIFIEFHFIITLKGIGFFYYAILNCASTHILLWMSCIKFYIFSI